MAKRGRPNRLIDEEQVLSLKAIGMKWNLIADLIGVSEKDTKESQFVIVFISSLFISSLTLWDAILHLVWTPYKFDTLSSHIQKEKSVWWGQLDSNTLPNDSC